MKTEELAIQNAVRVLKVLITHLESALGIDKAFPVTIKLVSAIGELDKLAEGKT